MNKFTSIYIETQINHEKRLLFVLELLSDESEL